MPLFRQGAQRHQSDVCGKSVSGQGVSRSTPLPSRSHSLKSFAWVLGWCLLGPAFAWGGTNPGAGTIVAAGFGYQAGDASTITVKTYDAESGEVLSDETYELNVKEEGIAKGMRPDERIFAGGVGPGATDLSNFVLRVYDAKTGKFQWEGNLNLTPQDAAGPGQRVSTLEPRRATVTRIASTSPSASAPSFLLRALDSSTGGLMWEDEFTTDGRLRMDRIANRLVSEGRRAALARPSFELHIRMFERDGRRLLWEDQVVQGDEDEEPQLEPVEDEARVLPTWPGGHERHRSEEKI
ncbi:MAG: hypothetical protein RI101_04070 [Nitrospira sp.]|jgi:hypothetical protein|nr:hypothetical protein [Nitrospira sp.]